MITMAQQPEDVLRMSAKPIIPKVDPHATLTVPIGPPPPTPDLPISMAAGPAPDVSTGMAAPKINSPASLPGIQARTGDRLMADYKKDADPYGSPDNHPGVFGKILHGLNVATGGVNRRQFEEQGLENRLTDLSKLESSENLQGAQGEEAQARADALENPQPKPSTQKWKTLFGGNGQIVTAPNGKILQENEQGDLRYAELPEGATVAPKPLATPHDAYNEWKSDPKGYEAFLKDVAAGKGTASKGFSAFGGLYAMIKAQQLAYTHNPALLPVYAAVLSAEFKHQGIPLPADAEKIIAQVPVGQPTNDQGQPIGTQMPGAPTAGTRGRGQFAGELLPTMKEAGQEIDRLGDKLGPFAGRYSDLITSKVGAYGPEFSGLQTDMQNIATGWGRAHGNSEKVMQEFRDDLNASKDPANLEAKLAHYEHQAEIYKQGGEGRPDKYSGNDGGFQVPEGAPAAPKEDGKFLYSDGKPVAKSSGGKWVAP